MNKEVRARAREGCVCLFVPWPEEEVVVQQGCSRLEELGLFPCSRPTAKYVSVHSLASSRAESSLLKLIVKVLVEVQILQ